MRGRRFGAPSSRGFSTEGLTVVRNRWRGFAELAQRLGRAGLEGDPVDRHGETELAGLVKRSATAELPVEGESARHVRLAFLEACRALLIAAGESRPIAAELAVAAGAAVLELLDLQARTAAAGWQRQFRDD